MDNRIYYLYKRILMDDIGFRSHTNPYYPATLIEELDVYEHPHNGDFASIWQFDLAKDESCYILTTWPGGESIWKERHR